MRIEQQNRRVEDLGADGRVHVKYGLQFFNEKNDVIENKSVQVFDGEKLIFDADTNAEGVAEIEVIADIMEETSKQVTFVVDGERSRDKVLLFEFGAKQREERMRALEDERRAREDKRRAEQKALEDKKEAERKALEDERIAKQKALEDERKACRNRINSCKRFFPDIGAGIVDEKGNEVVINEKGQLLSANRFDKIADFGTVPVTVAKFGTKYFLINAKGETRSDWYDEIVLDEKNQLAKVKRGNKYALIDLTGKIVFDWCDELTSSSIEGAWVVKRGKKYYLYAQLDNGQFEAKFRDFDDEFFPIGKGLMKILVKGYAYVINSEFEYSELVSFSQYLDELRQGNEITEEEYCKLRSLPADYEAAVKRSKTQHPEGEFPTLDAVEMELVKLGAAKLKAICNSMKTPSLSVEPFNSGSDDEIDQGEQSSTLKIRRFRACFVEKKKKIVKVDNKEKSSGSSGSLDGTGAVIGGLLGLGLLYKILK